MSSPPVYFRSGGRNPFTNKAWDYRVRKTNEILGQYNLPNIEVVERKVEEGSRYREWYGTTQRFACAPKELCSRPLLHAMMRLHRNGGNFLESMLHAVAYIHKEFPAVTMGSTFQGSESFLGQSVNPNIWAPILQEKVKYLHHWFNTRRESTFIQASMAFTDRSYLVKEAAETRHKSKIVWSNNNMLVLEGGREVTNYRLPVSFDGCSVWVYYRPKEAYAGHKYIIGGKVL
jgi:hypothetical protein